MAGPEPCDECGEVSGQKEPHRSPWQRTELIGRVVRTAGNMRVCRPCKSRLLGEVSATTPGWDPHDPMHPAQTTIDGSQCRQCKQALTRHQRRCRRHADPTIQAQLYREQQHWQMRRETYGPQRAKRQATARRLAGPRTHCEICQETNQLEADHIIDVLEFVRALGDRGFDAANQAWNLWWLCKRCHRIKTRGPGSDPHGQARYLRIRQWIRLRLEDHAHDLEATLRGTPA